MFCLICLDKLESRHIRHANRSAHLAYLDASPEAVCAGPLVDEDGETMIGSMILLDVPDRYTAEMWNAQDPYTRAGLFAWIEIHPWKHLYGSVPPPSH